MILKFVYFLLQFFLYVVTLSFALGRIELFPEILSSLDTLAGGPDKARIAIILLHGCPTAEAGFACVGALDLWTLRLAARRPAAARKGSDFEGRRDPSSHTSGRLYGPPTFMWGTRLSRTRKGGAPICLGHPPYSRPHTCAITPRLWSGMIFGLAGSVLIASLNRSASSMEENRLYSFNGPAISRTCSTV